MKTINVKVYNDKEILTEVAVVTEDGQPTVIQAKENVNYEFLDLSIDRAPNHIITKRVGKDLHVSFEKEGKETDLIIEGFYLNENQALIGLHESGNYYYYIPDTGEVYDYVNQLEEGAVEGQALGGEELASPLWLMLPSGFPWWLAGAALAAGGIAAALSGGGDDRAPAPAKPTSVEVGNGDDFITADEIDIDGKVEVTVSLPANAQTGDTVILNGVEKVLTATDITNNTAVVKVLAPAEGEKLIAIATIKDPAGNISEPATDEVSRDTTVPNNGLKVKVTITEDINNDSYINSSELVGTVGVTIDMPVNTVIGDTLTITNPDGTVTDIPVTQLMLNDGHVIQYPVTDFPEGVTKTVSAVIKDPAGNSSASGSDTATVDTTAPNITVNTLTTLDTTPKLTGTVDDTTAEVKVTVNGIEYTATNNGDGTWTLADDVITNALMFGTTYDVSIKAKDTVGNIGTDITNHELIIATPAKVNTITITDDTATRIDGVPVLPSNTFDGNIPDNGYTNDTKPTINITLDKPLFDGQSLVLKRDGVIIKTIDTSLNATSYSYTEPTDLSQTEGKKYTYTAETLLNGSSTSMKETAMNLDTIVEDVKFDDVDFTNKIISGTGESDGIICFDDDRNGRLDNGEAYAVVNADGTWALSYDGSQAKDVAPYPDSSSYNEDKFAKIAFVDKAGNLPTQTNQHLYIFDDLKTGIGGGNGTGLTKYDNPEGSNVEYATGAGSYINLNGDLVNQGDAGAEYVKATRFQNNSDKVILADGIARGDTGNVFAVFTGNGNDALVVQGTQYRKTRVYTEDGDDRYVIDDLLGLGTDRSIAHLGSGNDEMIVNGNADESLIILGEGDDSLNIDGYAYMVDIYGGDGSDTISIGDYVNGGGY